MSQNSPELDRLIEHCRRGDNEAWTELFQQFEQQVARWLARFDYTLRELDIADLRQAVFKKLHLKLPTYKSEQSFRSWLCEVTENIAIDDRRKRSAIKRTCPGEVVSLHTGESAEQSIVDPPDPGPGPGEAAAQRDTHRLLFEALARLGPPESRCHRLITLVYFAELTYEEVGLALDMKVNTVGTALRRCLDELRQLAAKVFSKGKITGTATES